MNESQALKRDMYLAALPNEWDPKIARSACGILLGVTLETDFWPDAVYLTPGLFAGMCDRWSVSISDVEVVFEWLRSG